MNDPVEHSLEQRLVRASRRILRPLVRILLRHGITASVFQEIARKVFVDVAHEEFTLDGKPQTLARVSVITGLNRKEVARLHKVEAMDDTDAVWWNRAGTVLAAWMADEQFLDRGGAPLDLPFGGEMPSFSELVRKHSGDMYPRAVADELLRLGAIEEINDRYRMTKRGYVPTKDPGMMVDILGLDTEEFLETLNHNLQAGADDKLTQIKVVADNLPIEDLDAFHRKSRSVMRNAFEDITRWLHEHDKGGDGPENEDHVKAGWGVFQIVRPPSPVVSTREDEDD